jgi:hypothetical protein
MSDIPPLEQKKEKFAKISVIERFLVIGQEVKLRNIIGRSINEPKSVYKNVSRSSHVLIKRYFILRTWVACETILKPGMRYMEGRLVLYHNLPLIYAYFRTQVVGSDGQAFEVGCVTTTQEFADPIFFQHSLDF